MLIKLSENSYQKGYFLNIRINKYHKHISLIVGLGRPLLQAEISYRWPLVIDLYWCNIWPKSEINEKRIWIGRKPW